MGTLIENLHNNNVIFSYYGFIDAKILNEVLQITKSKLEGNNELPIVVSRVHDAINECVDNVIRHNFYPDDEQVKYKSLLVVSKQKNDYMIDTIHVVNASQKHNIDAQLSFLGSHSREELLALRSAPLQATQVSKGLIDLVLKADNCDCTFRNLDTNYLFNINFKISSFN